MLTTSAARLGDRQMYKAALRLILRFHLKQNGLRSCSTRASQTTSRAPRWWKPPTPIPWRSRKLWVRAGGTTSACSPASAARAVTAFPDCAPRAVSFCPAKPKMGSIAGAGEGSWEETEARVAGSGRPVTREVSCPVGRVCKVTAQSDILSNNRTGSLPRAERAPAGRHCKGREHGGAAGLLPGESSLRASGRG